MEFDVAHRIFDDASADYNTGLYEQAFEKFMKLSQTREFAHIGWYWLAKTANALGDAVLANELFYKALTIRPDLCKSIFPENHPNVDYVWSGALPDEPVSGCGICGKPGKPHWTYFVMELVSAHVKSYNPVRTWMYCADCHHLYADFFPKQSKIPISSEAGKAMFATNPEFAQYSKIINGLGKYTQGNEMLEVGIGGLACALVAQELGYTVFGLDIVEGNVLAAHKHGIDAQWMDVSLFESDKQWDIIMMGDVIEHVEDPVAVMKKMHSLLAPNGVIWLSTPNFDGAFTRYAGHGDPMRLESVHKNYFSKQSLFLLFDKAGLVPVEYTLSPTYNGSIEVIVTK